MPTSTTIVAGSILDPITTADRFRATRPPLEGYELVTLAVTISLLEEEPRRARYEFEVGIETSGAIPARYWCYYLPLRGGEITGLRAWDARGKLHPRLQAGEDADGVRLEIRLRDPVIQGGRYIFSYGYESAIHATVVSDGRSRTVSYSDWVIFNIPCGQVRIHIELPRGGEPLDCHPAAIEDEGGRLAYRVRDVQPLETVAFNIAYRRLMRVRQVARLRGMLGPGEG